MTIKIAAILLSLSAHALASPGVLFEGHKDPDLKIEWRLTYKATAKKRTCSRPKLFGAGMGLPSFSWERVPKMQELTVVTDAGSDKFSVEAEKVLRGKCKYTLASTRVNLTSALTNQRSQDTLWVSEAQVGPYDSVDFECLPGRSLTCYPIRYDRRYPRNFEHRSTRLSFGVRTRPFPVPSTPTDAIDIGGKHGTFEIVSPILQDYRNQNGGELPAVYIGPRIVAERLTGKLRCTQTTERAPTGTGRLINVNRCTLSTNGKEMVLRYSLDELIDLMKRVVPGEAPWTAEADFQYDSRGVPSAWINNVL